MNKETQTYLYIKIVFYCVDKYHVKLTEAQLFIIIIFHLRLTQIKYVLKK